MTIPTPFSPQSRIDADNNAIGFIARARNELTAFGAGLDFDSDCWDITAHSLEKGDRRARMGRMRLNFGVVPDEPGLHRSATLRTFAKAYVRSQVAHLRYTTLHRTITAFEVLGKAMNRIGTRTIAECDAACFDVAVDELVAQTTAVIADGVGPCLGQIARFIDRSLMCIYPLSRWKYRKQLRSQIGRVGEAFETRRRRLMPDPDAIDALAQAYRQASDPRDILVTSVAAILCSAPERINEVLVLAADCEVEQVGEDGRDYLGLRWAGSKGYADHVKLILPGMAGVVREALHNIRAITEPARQIARWYEKHPTSLYLPDTHEHLRTNEFVEFEDVAELAGIGAKARGTARLWVNSAGIPVTMIRRKSGHLAMVVRFSDLERHIISLLPIEFPVLDGQTGLRYADALMVVPRGLFKTGKGSLCMIEPLRYHHVGNGLGQNRAAGSATVFQRVGIDPDRRLRINSHQFRHWLNTLAQGSNLSQVDIAKWSGRNSVRQNAFYDHVTSEEIVEQIRAKVGDHAKAIGPIADIPKNLPVSRGEYAAMAVPTAHATLYGFCIHDFAASPCEMFRKCLDCREHVCIKGLPDRVERIERSLELASSHLEQAKRAVADGIYGAEDWVATHQGAVDRLRDLLAILHDPQIEDGAVIQLGSQGTHSLSESVAYDHLADAPVVDRMPRSFHLSPDTEEQPS